MSGCVGGLLTRGVDHQVNSVASQYPSLLSWQQQPHSVQTTMSVRVLTSLPLVLPHPSLQTTLTTPLHAGAQRTRGGLCNPLPQAQGAVCATPQPLQPTQAGQDNVTVLRQQHSACVARGQCGGDRWGCRLGGVCCCMWARHTHTTAAHECTGCSKGCTELYMSAQRCKGHSCVFLADLCLLLCLIRHATKCMHDRAKSPVSERQGGIMCATRGGYSLLGVCACGWVGASG